MVDAAIGVDDAVFAAERCTGVDHLVEQCRDLRVVVGVLVGEQKFGGGGDLARSVAVHPRDRVGPFPALAVEVEPETSALWGCIRAEELITVHRYTHCPLHLGTLGSDAIATVCRAPTPEWAEIVHTAVPDAAAQGTGHRAE